MKFYQSIFLFCIVVCLFSGCQDNTETMLTEVKSLLAKGDFKTAIPLLEQVTEQAPLHADAWNMLGIAHYETRSMEKAISFFNKAIKIDNRNYKYFYNRANAQREQKLLLEALEDYNLALELEKNKADIYFNKAVVLADLNRKKEAILAFEQCLGIDPNFAKAHYGIASAQISLEQKVAPTSCEHLQKALELGYTLAAEAIALYCK
jgi:tetratricopeptide (TPR) repeat protein